MTTPTPSKPSPQATSFPSDILMNLIAGVLAPMFLAASGDMQFARMAAIETMKAYHARHEADLIAIAQIIACGLAALGSLSLSITNDVSLPMMLRLRGNANALNRAAEQNRRVLRECRSDPTAAYPGQTLDEAVVRHVAGPEDALYEATVLADLAATQKRMVATQTVPRVIAPAAKPAAVTASAPRKAAKAPSRVVTEREWQARWAAATADVAVEFTADLKNLPPVERKLASVRAAALITTANALMSGVVPPRPKPGNLARIIRT